MDKYIEDIIKAVEEGSEKWYQENSPEKIAKAVIAAFNSEKKEIVSKLLGFNNKYSYGWEVDHCNGRAGESAVGDHIRSYLDKDIKKWFDSLRAENPLEDLKDAYQKEYNDMLQAGIRKAIKEHAESRAYEFVHKYMEDTPLQELNKWIDAFNKLKQHVQGD